MQMLNFEQNRTEMDPELGKKFTKVNKIILKTLKKSDFLFQKYLKNWYSKWSENF